MDIAMLFAHWQDFGEPWCLPVGVKNQFEASGHSVSVYNLYAWNGKLDPRHNIRKYANEGFNQLTADIRRGKPCDVIMVMDYGPWQCPLLNKENFPHQVLIKESGDEPQAHRMHLQTAQQFDIVLSPDWQCVENYQRYGINAYWWTQFADHRIFYKRDVSPIYDCVSTCGGRRHTAEIQKELGSRFNNERYFFGNDHATRLHLGKIVFQNSQYGEITRRIFEGMACGRMVLTDRLPDHTRLQELFVDGQDIVYYDDAKDAIDKIDYYASHDEQREQIALNGHNKVMQGHTVEQRVNQLISFIEEIKCVK